jgi:hypothetical protein
VRLADEAVLAQVARLKGIPWEPQATDEVVRRDPHEAERRRLCGAIAADEDALAANATAFRVAGGFSLVQPITMARIVQRGARTGKGRQAT